MNDVWLEIESSGYVLIEAQSNDLLGSDVSQVRMDSFFFSSLDPLRKFFSGFSIRVNFLNSSILFCNAAPLLKALLK